MNWIIWIIVGLVAGALAKLIMPGKQGGGFFATMILGIVGALLGGLIGGTLMNFNVNSGFNFVTILWAVIGAIIVSFLWSWIRGRNNA
jgi:uncharacterized membrane protein YeaQ/YmgE (transglycosylase-associated protein family)